jgi:hypothetical protein
VAAAGVVDDVSWSNLPKLSLFGDASASGVDPKAVIELAEEREEDRTLVLLLPVEAVYL